MKQLHSQASDSNEAQISRRGWLSKFKMALRALRHRNYRLFFAGQLVSLIGTWMQNIAQSWLVYRLTGSSFLLGSIGFASQIPVFLLAFVGGSVADRYNRHRIIVGAQVASMLLALILSVLTLTHTVRIWHIFVLSALLGVVNAFDMPARQAFVVELVEKEDLMNAIALNSSTFNGARILGPSVAGILIAGIGEGWCFFANGISYIAVIAGLLLMKMEAREETPSRQSALSSVLEGFQFVHRAKPIRALLLLLGLVGLFAMPYSVLMPIFADKILHGKMVAFACAGFASGLILFSVSRTFWLSALFLLPVGFSLMVQMACTNTLIQIMVPDGLRGRVMSTHIWMFLGMAPFGSLLAGAIAGHVGAPATILVGSFLCLAGAGLFALRLPKFQLSSR
jgi:MFS family permease